MLGISKQAVHQHKRRGNEYLNKISDLIVQVDELRKEHPGCGVEKMYETLKPDFIGRDKFIEVFMSLGYRVKKVKNYVRTTIPTHLKYPNLIEDFTPISPNQLWVSDITYINTEEGVMYLFLITDAYSKKILGWCLSDNLKAENAVTALKMALGKYENTGGQLIHHSDRGVQYCSAEYVKILQAYGIAISMTQDGNPLDNPIAERINGILKNEWLNDIEIKTKRSAKIHVTRTINIYNNIRPHLSLNMLTPQQVHYSLVSDRSPKRLWKNYYQKEQFSYCRQGAP